MEEEEGGCAWGARTCSLRLISRRSFAFTLAATAVLLATVSAVRPPTGSAPYVPMVQGAPEFGSPDFLCTACLFASAEADKKLHEPATYAAFKSYVENKVCTSLR